MPGRLPQFFEQDEQTVDLLVFFACRLLLLAQPVEELRPLLLPCLQQGAQVLRLRLPGVSRDRDALTLDIVAVHIMLHAAGEHVACAGG